MHSANRKYRRSPFAVLILLVLLAVLTLPVGCGKKGPPIAPQQTPPPAVDDLKADVSGNRLRLTWTGPDGYPWHAGRLEGYTVYRSRQRSGQQNCPGCPVLFERVGDVGAGEINAWEDTLEPGTRYIYKVSAYTRSGLTSDSSLLELIH